MKYPLFFLLFASLVGIGSPSYAEWQYLIKSTSGDDHYIDFNSLEREGDYVYFWSLRDYGKADKWGDLSSKKYLKVDCAKYKFKYLSDSYHNRPMAKGIPTDVSRIPDKNWTNITSNTSVIGIVFKKVCN